MPGIQFSGTSSTTAGYSGQAVGTIVFSGSGATGLMQTSATNTWTLWVQQAQLSTSNTTWIQWSTDTGTASSITLTGANWSTQAAQMAAAQRPRSEAEVQQELRQREQWRTEQLRIEGEKQKARGRAELLLQEHLSDQQKAKLAEKGYFELKVLSRDGSNKIYRIHRKWSHSIEQLDAEGRKLKTLCIHPRIATPIEDSMLAQKLMLESGLEEELLRIANHS